MLLPILFLNDVAGTQNKAISQFLNASVYAGWLFLGLSVLSAIGYQFGSAKWVKLAWHQQTDMFGFSVQQPFVEWWLDATYFLMMTGFVVGFSLMLTFVISFRA